MVYRFLTELELVSTKNIILFTKFIVGTYLLFSYIKQVITKSFFCILTLLIWTQKPYTFEEPIFDYGYITE